MHSFEGTEIKEIPVGSEIVQLDGFEKCPKYNALLVLCEKREGLKLVKYIRLLDLDTFEQLNDDVKLAE